MTHLPNGEAEEEEEEYPKIFIGEASALLHAWAPQPPRLHACAARKGVRA